MTKTFALVALALGLAGAPVLAYADDACMTQATDKKLAGAAKTSFMTKCERTGLRRPGRRQEARRRRQGVVRQEVHERRDGDVSLTVGRAALESSFGDCSAIRAALIDLTSLSGHISSRSSYSLTAPVSPDT